MNFNYILEFLPRTFLFLWVVNYISCDVLDVKEVISKFKLVPNEVCLIRFEDNPKFDGFECPRWANCMWNATYDDVLCVEPLTCTAEESAACGEKCGVCSKNKTTGAITWTPGTPTSDPSDFHNWEYIDCQCNPGCHLVTDDDDRYGAPANGKCQPGTSIVSREVCLEAFAKKGYHDKQYHDCPDDGTCWKDFRSGHVTCHVKCSAEDLARRKEVSSRVCPEGFHCIRIYDEMMKAGDKGMGCAEDDQ